MAALWQGTVTSQLEASRKGSWIRLKFLPLKWASDTTEGERSLSELLKETCGLERCWIDFKDGYKHQANKSGPMYAYAYIKVEHIEDVGTVINRISAHVMEGIKLKATLRRPGHQGAGKPGDTVCYQTPGTALESQAPMSPKDQQGQDGLPGPSGLTGGGQVQQEVEITGYHKRDDQHVWVISSDGEEEQLPPP